MKKLSVVFVCLLIVNVMFPQLKKEVVIVGDVKCSLDNSKQVSANVHDAIVKAFVNKNLHEVIDLNTLSAVDQEKFRQSGEGALTVENLSRLSDSRVKGADYVVLGTLSNFSTVQANNSEGKFIGYKAQLSFTVKVTNLVDGTQKGISTVDCSATEPTEQGAVMKAVRNADSKLLKEIVKIFPPSGAIVEITAEKKNVAKTLVLEVGSAVGVVKGNLFKVCEKKKYRGKILIKEIGRLRVTEVQGEDFCECKITKGGDLILKKFNEEKDIYAEQLPKDGGLKTLWDEAKKL